MPAVLTFERWVSQHGHHACQPERLCICYVFIYYVFIYSVSCLVLLPQSCSCLSDLCMFEQAVFGSVLLPSYCMSLSMSFVCLWLHTRGLCRAGPIQPQSPDKNAPTH